MSGALDGITPLATTGVGSLPFARAANGARHSVRAYDIPFCPQLPALDGDMVCEWLGSDPRRCGWGPDRDHQRPAAWNAFLDALTAAPEGSRRQTRIVKLQVTGPMTLAIALERAAGRAGAAPGTRALAGELSTWLAANAAEQVRTLTTRGFAALLIVDEPGLAHAGLDPSSPADVGVWDPLRNTGAAAWGLHICGSVPWALVRAVSPELVSFDVVRHGLNSDAQAALNALLTRGTRVAWGVIDPVDPEGAEVVAALASVCIRALAVGRTFEEVAARSLLTPSCGTGRLSAHREQLIAAVLQAAAMAATTTLATTGARPAPAGTQ